MQRAIVFTGQVRNPARFGQLLRMLNRDGDVVSLAGTQASGPLRLIFSTWDGELDAYPEIAAELSRLDAQVIQQPQPNLVLPGHVLHQLMSLDAALADVDDDTFVMKCRPDFCHQNDVLRALDLQPLPLPPDAHFPTPFRRRMHIVSAFGAHPFYITDITFAGLAGDLRHLARLPFTFLTRYLRLSPEQLYWGCAACADFLPVFDALFRVNVGLIFNDPARSAAVRRVLSDNTLFAGALACYATMMTESFCPINGDPAHDAAYDKAAAHTVEALLWDPIDVPGLESHPTALTNGFRSFGLWQAIRDGRFAGSVLGESVRAALAEYAVPGGVSRMQQQRGLLLQQAADFANRIERDAGIGGMKHPRATEIGVRFGGQPAEWLLGQTGSPLTDKLEREINDLRRIVDQLNDQLRRRQPAVVSP